MEEKQEQEQKQESFGEKLKHKLAEVGETAVELPVAVIAAAEVSAENED